MDVCLKLLLDLRMLSLMIRQANSLCMIFQIGHLYSKNLWVGFTLECTRASYITTPITLVPRRLSSMQFYGLVLRQIPSTIATPLSLNNTTSKCTHSNFESLVHSTMGNINTEGKIPSPALSLLLSSLQCLPRLLEGTTKCSSPRRINSLLHWFPPLSQCLHKCMKKHSTLSKMVPCYRSQMQNYSKFTMLKSLGWLAQIHV